VDISTLASSNATERTGNSVTARVLAAAEVPRAAPSREESWMQERMAREMRERCC